MEDAIMTFSYNKLWKILIDKNMMKTDLIREAKISTNSMARMGKNEDVRLETLAKIALALDCKLDDLVDYVSEENEESN
jgi:DNA-binding Xre family transcriptional regulator